MNGDALAQLELTTNELAAAVKSLVSSCRNVPVSASTINGSSDASLTSAAARPKHTNGPPALVPPEASRDAVHARSVILSNLAKLQSMVGEPGDFLKQLAEQNQRLACLKWLGEFQVLACIPLSGSVPIKDVADLAGVPESTLARVIRMTATAGLLCEPQPGHVAHTSLSAPFVTKPSLLDAAMFMSETSAPSALNMAAATTRFGDSKRANESPYNVAFQTEAPFANICEQSPKLQRQWPAYLRHVTGDVDASTIDILSRLDWRSLSSNSSVVMVNARSPSVAVALADLYPTLHFFVQLGENQATRQQAPNRASAPNAAQSGGRRPSTAPGSSAGQIPDRIGSRISVQQRVAGTPQAVHDAAVYILRIPSPSPREPWHALSGSLVAELRAHMGVVRASPTATLVLTAALLPEPGTVDPDAEASARLRDLSLLQLANDREAEVIEVVNMINSVKDPMGQLVVVNRRHTRNSAVVALEVRYQPYTDSPDLTQTSTKGS